METLVAAAQPKGFLRLDPRPMRFRRAWVGRLLLDPGLAGHPSEPVIVDLVRPVGRGAERWLRALYDLADARSVIDATGVALDRRYLARAAASLGVRGKLRSLGV